MSGVKRDCACPRAQHRHGTRAAYAKDGCRCFPCRVANSRISAQAASGLGYTEGLMLPRCAVTRRLEALHAIGWSESAIGQRLGVTKQAVNNLRTHDGPHVTLVTMARVAAVYDELWDQAPTGKFVTRTVNWARRCGWVPPLAWDDDDIDDPAAVPHMPTGGGWDLAPCGTDAAARRHQRHGEPLDAACRAAARRTRAERRRSAA